MSVVPYGKFPEEDKWVPESNRSYILNNQMVNISGLSTAEYNMLYNKCALRTVKLYNLPWTCDHTHLKNALFNELYVYEEREGLPGVEDVQINVFTPQNWYGPKPKPSSFGLIVAGDDAASDVLFRFLFNRINNGLFFVAGNCMSIDFKYPTPSNPSPAVLAAAIDAYLIANEQSKSRSMVPPPMSPTAFPALPALRQALPNINIHYAASPPAVITAPPTMPPLVVRAVTAESKEKLYRESLGSLKGPLIAKEHLSSFCDAVYRKFDDFLEFLHSHLPSIIEIVSVGTTFYSKALKYQLGKPGAEGAVFIGLFFPKELHVTKANVLDQLKRSNPGFYRVAVKSYHPGFMSKEVEVTRAFDANRKGVIAYLDDFKDSVDDSQVYVQELGMVNLREYYDDMYCNDEKPIHDSRLPELMQEKLHIVRGLCGAVHELHKKGIVHRDLRMPNVMLMETGQLKICDFGLSRLVQKGDKVKSTYKGHLHLGQPREILESEARIQKYLAHVKTASVSKGGFSKSSKSTEGVVSPSTSVNPLLSDLTESEKQGIVTSDFPVDIFMLGCLIAETIQGMHPFPSVHSEANNNDILNGTVPDLFFEDWFPGANLLIHLLVRMLSHDPLARPTSGEVLVHPFFLTWTERRNTLFQLDTILHHEKNPIYNSEFKEIECLLQPMEEIAAKSGWQSQVDPLVTRHFKTSAVPTIVDGSGKQGAHPLPQMHQVVRFIRNVMHHIDDPAKPEAVMEVLRGPSCRMMPSVPGDYLCVHSSVSWFFLELWLQRNKYVRHMDDEMKAESRRHNEELDRLELKQQHFKHLMN